MKTKRTAQISCLDSLSCIGPQIWGRVTCKFWCGINIKPFLSESGKRFLRQANRSSQRFSTSAILIQNTRGHFHRIPCFYFLGITSWKGNGENLGERKRDLKRTSKPPLAFKMMSSVRWWFGGRSPLLRAHPRDAMCVFDPEPVTESSYIPGAPF